MERKKIIILFIFCISIFVAGCGSEKKEAKKKIKDNPIKTASNHSGDKPIISEPQIVHWMYMDDSLRNNCRPLFYTLPWMESDIRVLPEMVTPEILSLAPMQSYVKYGTRAGRLNDSVYYYHYLIAKDNCKCEVLRLYKGIDSDKNFSGYSITEQILCNAKTDMFPKFMNEVDKKKTSEKDTVETYEVHGHDH